MRWLSTAQPTGQLVSHWTSAIVAPIKHILIKRSLNIRLQMHFLEYSCWYFTGNCTGICTSGLDSSLINHTFILYCFPILPCFILDVETDQPVLGKMCQKCVITQRKKCDGKKH